MGWMHQPARWSGLARRLVYPALLLAVAVGCQAVHRYRPVSVLVKDADTGEPVCGAEVRVSYPHTDSPLAPPDTSETTGADGVARLRAAPYGDTGINVEATAKGYLAEETFLSVKAVESIEPAPLLGADQRRDVSLVLALHAGPRPTVELVVPTGYRGVVRAELHVEEGAPCPPGQRRFSVAVPPSGVVQVTGPALLRRVDSPDFRARYADGALLSRDAKESEIGLWGLGFDRNTWTFLVGTRAEYTIYRSR
jgi:hypothetical protein